jgi:hypothetical protein
MNSARNQPHFNILPTQPIKAPQNISHHGQGLQDNFAPTTSIALMACKRLNITHPPNSPRHYLFCTRLSGSFGDSTGRVSCAWSTRERGRRWRHCGREFNNRPSLWWWCSCLSSARKTIGPRPWATDDLFQTVWRPRYSLPHSRGITTLWHSEK